MKDKLNKLMKNLWLFVSVILVISLLVTISRPIKNSIFSKSLESDEILSSLYGSIDIAREKGDYNCCINPPCTMCYLGKWKFDKGTCYCDDAIAEGRTEDVCPECKAGLEKGVCESAEKEEGCILDEKIYGGETA